MLLLLAVPAGQSLPSSSGAPVAVMAVRTSSEAIVAWTPGVAEAYRVYGLADDTLTLLDEVPSTASEPAFFARVSPGYETYGVTAVTAGSESGMAFPREVEARPQVGSCTLIMSDDIPPQWALVCEGRFGYITIKRPA